VPDWKVIGYDPQTANANGPPNSSAATSRPRGQSRRVVYVRSRASHLISMASDRRHERRRADHSRGDSASRKQKDTPIPKRSGRSSSVVTRTKTSAEGTEIDKAFLGPEESGGLLASTVSSRERRKGWKKFDAELQKEASLQRVRRRFRRCEQKRICSGRRSTRLLTMWFRPGRERRMTLIKSGVFSSGFDVTNARHCAATTIR